MALLPHTPTTNTTKSGSTVIGQPYTPPQAWTSWVVPSIIIVNIAVFAYSLYVDNCIGSRHACSDDCCVFTFLHRFAFEPLSVNPFLGPTIETLDALGALNYERIITDREGWRFLTCTWLHSGFIPLAANMLSLSFVGIRLEQEFGFDNKYCFTNITAKIGTIYVLSGFGGSLMSALSLRSNISVGSSGSLFGLLGAMISELIINWTIYGNKCAALLTLIVLSSVNVIVGYFSNIDGYSIIGGFVSGFLIGFILLIHPQFGYVNHKYISSGYNTNSPKRKYKLYQYLLWIVALILLILGCMAALTKLCIDIELIQYQ